MILLIHSLYTSLMVYLVLGATSTNSLTASIPGFKCEIPNCEFSFA